MEKSNSPGDFVGPDGPHFAVPEDSEAAKKYSAWEEVAAGRFMPRRIRGSCQGRALG